VAKNKQANWSYELASQFDKNIDLKYNLVRIEQDENC